MSECKTRVAETALLQVKIGKRWIAWSKINRRHDENWNGEMLLQMKPQTRIRFVKRKP